MFIYFLVFASLLADPKLPITYDAPATKSLPRGFEPVAAKPKISFEYDEPPVKVKQTVRQAIAFGTPWCVYCVKIKGPEVASLRASGWLVSDSTKEQAHLLLVNLEVDKSLAKLWKVPDTPLPVFILIENDKEVSRHIGKLSANEIADFYNRAGKFDPKQPKQVKTQVRINSAVTWPGDTEASLREHLKGEPHFVNTDGMSFQQMVELHDTWHLAHPEHTGGSGGVTRHRRR